MLFHYFSVRRPSHQHVIIYRSNKWQSVEKLKVIRKQLFSNHLLTLSSHCVLYLWRKYSLNDTFPIYLSLVISLPFVQPVVVKMWRIWDIADQLLMADKLTEKLTGMDHIFHHRYSIFNSFSTVHLCCGGSKLRKDVQMSFSPTTSSNSLQGNPWVFPGPDGICIPSSSQYCGEMGLTQGCRLSGIASQKDFQDAFWSDAKIKLGEHF